MVGQELIKAHPGQFSVNRHLKMVVRPAGTVQSCFFGVHTIAS